MADRDIDTAAGFLDERKDFLCVRAFDNPAADGFDIWLRIDGTHTSDGYDAKGREELVRGMETWLEKVLANEGIHRDQMPWWGKRTGEGPSEGCR